ncbi:hypothetical protein [Streptomyces violascens]|uniref:Uncharacterized protein n=1 Tax=Streptomyces violascens TaxID=67381 RepID=A0ABQ3R248_9ACTN|nr:hypothetical protein [Streptomyces violascens]GGU32253.1 hypothetical protein GCM10010289_61860 [Streptomyces violascens]GHI43611.1 hypothetical protein Sviol_80190 [Streptomyces violascens]
MPAATPRPHVMALLFDTDFKRPTDSLVFRHLDGRLFTEEEQAIVRNATIEELQAAGVHVHNPEAEADAAAAATTLVELLLKYAVRHHETLAPLMTDEDLIEYDRLATVVAAGAQAVPE